jgi:hypothetical protein
MADDPIPPAQPFKKDAPCSGPNCSRAPVVPTPAPVAPAAPEAQEWACILAPEAAATKSSFPFTYEDPRERPLSMGSSIYHPPR